MAGEGFDNLAIGLANRTISRRRALQLAAASALATAGLGVATREAEARPTCPRRGTGCFRPCRHTSKECYCIRTTEGNRVCIHPCCSGKSCNRSSQCKSGEVCLKTNCCGRSECVTRCTEPVPDYCGPTAGSRTSSSAAWG
jgi:hypothetical protein